jgi:hypothetical protein
MMAETKQKTESESHKRRNTILLAVVLLTVFGIGWLVQHRMLGNSGPAAVVQYNGEIIHRLPLNRETSVVVGDRDGDYNIVTVKDGKVSVTETNCPDQICVEMGWLSNGITPIVCMPARLSINLEYDPAEDDVGVDVVTR